MLLPGGLSFEDDKERIPVAETYIHSEYKQVAASRGHTVTEDDVRSILPQVTRDELARKKKI